MIHSADAAPCTDPSCAGRAEPETDGDHQYLVCTVCGYEFGYRKTAAPTEPTCAAGIPDSVRRAGSSPMTPPVNGPPLLQIGRRPPDG